MVVTEFIAPAAIAGKETGMFWRILSESDEDGSLGLGFYRAENDQRVCRLVLTGESQGLYFADGARFPHTVSSGDLMVFPGLSIPCDLLPVAAACKKAGEPTVFESRRHVGENTFIEQFQVDCVPVSIKEALSKGWLREAIEGTESLFMIRVTSLRTGENIARQLWVIGDAWWRYGETPYRQSWRLP